MLTPHAESCVLRGQSYSKSVQSEVGSTVGVYFHTPGPQLVDREQGGAEHHII